MNFSRTVFCIAAAGVLAGGCVNLEPTADPTRFFTLGAPASDATVVTGDGPRVGVRIVSISDYLRRTEIVVRDGAHEITYSENNHWAGRLEDAMSHVVVGALRRELPALSILPSSGVQSFPPELVVEVGVVAAEGVTDGRASLELSWRIVGGKDGASPRVGGFADVKSGWNRNDFGQLAELLSALATEAAVKMAADIAATAKA